MHKTNILFIPIVLSLTACFGTTIKDVNEYGIKPMVKAEVVPSQNQLDGESYKVAVLDIDDKNMNLANQSNVGTSIKGELVKHISKSNVVLIDTKILPDLLAALRDRSKTYSSSKVDYALTGQVTVANYGKGYTKISYYKDKKGKVNVIEPYCTYSASVQGNINIHDATNNLDIVEIVAISGGHNREITVPRNQKSCQDLSQNEIQSLVRTAGTKAMSREDVLIQNFFRSKGYVLEHRIRGKENIFKISMGKINGVTEDQTAEIYTLEKDKNQLTNKVSLNENKIGTAKVSNIVDKKYAWIVVDDEQIASQIRLGDVVKIKYEKGFLDSIFNRSNNN